jgi:hypothetical protein
MRTVLPTWRHYSLCHQVRVFFQMLRFSPRSLDLIWPSVCSFPRFVHPKTKTKTFRLHQTEHKTYLVHYSLPTFSCVVDSKALSSFVILSRISSKSKVKEVLQESIIKEAMVCTSDFNFVLRWTKVSSNLLHLRFSFVPRLDSAWNVFWKTELDMENKCDARTWPAQNRCRPSKTLSRAYLSRISVKLILSNVTSGSPPSSLCVLICWTILSVRSQTFLAALLSSKIEALAWKKHQNW